MKFYFNIYIFFKYNCNFLEIKLKYLQLIITFYLCNILVFIYFNNILMFVYYIREFL